ncbi:MAG: hypothetical protein ACLSVD_06135 [Eggerthellaceae bacterium]
MVNIMRMDLYRRVHGKSLWIFLAAIAALAAMGAGMMGVVTDPAFMESMAMSYTNGAPAGVNIGFSSSGPDASDLAEANAAVAMLAQGLSPEALIGNVFLGGGGLSCLFVIFLAIFLASEFESGFSKNVFTVQPRGLISERTLEVPVLAALFTALAIGRRHGRCRGLELSPPPTDLLVGAPSR